MTKPTTIVQADTWLSLSAERRRKVRDWLRANQLEANDIMISESLTVEGETIHYTALLRNEDGSVRTNKGTISTDSMVMSAGDIEVLTERRSVPLLSPFPG